MKNKNKNRIFGVSAVVFLVGMFYLGATRPVTKKFSTVQVNLNELIRAHTYSKGPSDAKVTVVEFLDPECEACRKVHPIVQQLLSEYSGRLRIAYRYMPFHNNSVFAASALEEARERSKFEEALNLLFEKQPEWGSHAQPKPELIPEYLKALGIDPKSLDRAVVIGKHGAKIEIDRMDGMKFGVTGTPTFFVNGRKVMGIDYDKLKAAIELALAEAK